MNVFLQTSRIHHLSENRDKTVITQVVVDSPIAKSFSNSLKNFHKHLYELELIESWGPLVSFMKRFHFLLASSILPPAMIRNFSASKNPFEKDKMAEVLARSDQDTIELYRALHHDYSALHVYWEANPLWNAFLKHGPTLTPDGGNFSGSEILFCCNSFSLTNSMNNFLSHRAPATDGKKPFSIATNAQVRTINNVYRSIVITGTGKWLQNQDENHLLSTPKSARVYLFSYSHFDLELPSRSDLTSEQPSSPIPARIINYENEEPSIAQKASVSTPEDLSEFTIPKLNLNKAREGISERNSVPEGDEEEIEAICYLLSGGKLLFQESDGSFFHLDYFQDGESISCSSVSKKPADQIAGGDIILVSTSGGGDMIKPVADEILKKAGKLDDYRSLQKRWKEKLREQYVLQGSHRLISKLEQGGVALNHANLHYWISSRCIGPGDDMAFGNLLEFLDLFDQSEDIKEATRGIRTAHQTAGRVLAGKLRQSIEGKSLKELFECGEQQFSHDDFEGSQTAYLIEKRFSETSVVPAHELLKIKEIGEDAWL